METNVRAGRPPVNRWASFGEAIHASGKSEQEIALALGVKPKTIADWRRGNRTPHFSAIPVIAKLLGTSEAALLADAPIKKFANRYATR